MSADTPDALHDAISDVMSRDHQVVTSFVACVAVMNDDGEQVFRMMAPPDTPEWVVRGLLAQGISVLDYRDSAGAAYEATTIYFEGDK